MKTDNKTRRQPTNRDVYDEVTSYVVSALEQGSVIWQKPWHSMGLPRNITGTTSYRGWNAFLLNFVCLLKHYTFPCFITYRQARQLGGTVKKGEHGYQIIYWAEVVSRYPATTVVDESTGLEKEVRPLIRVPKVHTVFNIDQTEGIDYDLHVPGERSQVEKIDACESVVGGMPQRPNIIHLGNAACYIPSTDEVFMPGQGWFISDEAYYATLFHELAHSTGHQTRLNREELVKTDGFGGQTYSKEELTAELTSAYLCGVTGIRQTTIDNSAAYIQGWLKKLKNDKKFFLKAATQAQAAADFILHVGDNKTSLPAQSLNLSRVEASAI